MLFFVAPFSLVWFFLPYINDLTDNVICDVAIYADDTTLYSKYDKASHFLAATRIGFRT